MTAPGAAGRAADWWGTDDVCVRSRHVPRPDACVGPDPEVLEVAESVKTSAARLLKQFAQFYGDSE